MSRMETTWVKLLQAKNPDPIRWIHDDCGKTRMQCPDPKPVTLNFV